jgi:sulfonate transport system substrate-binding protein
MRWSLLTRRFIRSAISLTAIFPLIDFDPSRRDVPTHEPVNQREMDMSNMTHSKHRVSSYTRKAAAALVAAAITLCSAAAAFADDTIVLRIGDQKGGNRSLLDISGLSKNLPYKIEWSEFPAAAPILEALNAGALDVGYTGDLSFLSVYAAGAPIKAIGGTRSHG